MPDRAALLKQLDETVLRFLDCLRALVDLQIQVYKGWSAGDVLGHITFWHESFARNVNDLVNGQRPSPLKGRLRDLNPAGVAEMRRYPPEEVIRKLEAAQQSIRENLLDPGLTLIPYKKGSRDYTPEEHLQIVIDHIRAHLQDIEKATRSIQS